MKTTAIILAAGTSSRMGEKNKLIIPWSGEPIIKLVVKNILESNVSDVVVVTGYQREKIEDILDGFSVKMVHNHEYNSGMTSSIKTGVKGITGGVIVCMGDMPEIPSQDYNQVLPINSEKSIRVPVFNVKRGNPVYFSQHFHKELLNHDSSDGCKGVILSNESFVTEIDFNTDYILKDIDTESDLSRQ